MRRLLTKLTSAWVEWMFPDTAFYGQRYLDSFAAYAESNPEQTTGTASGAALAYLCTELSRNYQSEATLTFKQQTFNGRPVGDWKIVVRQVGEPREGQG